MNLLRTFYRRLIALQRQRGVKIALTVVACIFIAASFGTLLIETYSLHRQFGDVSRALAGKSLQAGDDAARTILQTGTVTVRGRTYGGEKIRLKSSAYFNSQGVITPVHANVLTIDLLESVRPAWAPDWLIAEPETTWLLAGCALVWVLLVIWMELTVPLLLTILLTAVPVSIGYVAGSLPIVFATGGIGLLTFSYVLLVRAAMLVWSRARQISAVAHTVLKESTRTRMGIVFIVLLLGLLPLIPFVLNPEDPLRYRIQTFISWSLGITFSIAAVLTLFLSCATVAFEIRDRQIWQVVSKPVSRWNYVIGKWTGVVSLNAIILLLAGISIFTYIQYLSRQPVSAGESGILDSLSVRDEVLTARQSARPQYPTLTAEQIRDQVDKRINETPELAQLDEVPARTSAEIRRQVEESFSNLQRSVPPAGGYRTFVFKNITTAARSSSTLTLRYRFHILRDDEHETYPAIFAFNEDPATAVQQTYVPTIRHTMPIPPSMINNNGELVLTVVNMYEPTPEEAGRGHLSWELQDFELLYRVSSFEGNFVRAMLVMWVKLAFLAALGVGCATFLSFPVACLLSFTVFIAGLMGPFLAESLGMYHPISMEHMDWSNVGLVIQWAFQWVIRLLALLLVFLLSGFGEIKPAEALVEGRFISWFGVGVTVLKLGVLWSGLALAVGYQVLRRRQLAIYSGQGG